MIINFHFTLSGIIQPWRLSGQSKSYSQPIAMIFVKPKISNNDKTIYYPLAWRFSSKLYLCSPSCMGRRDSCQYFIFISPRPSETIDSCSGKNSTFCHSCLNLVQASLVLGTRQKNLENSRIYYLTPSQLIFWAWSTCAGVHYWPAL